MSAPHSLPSSSGIPLPPVPAQSPGSAPGSAGGIPGTGQTYDPVITLSSGKQVKIKTFYGPDGQALTNLSEAEKVALKELFKKALEHVESQLPSTSPNFRATIDTQLNTLQVRTQEAAMASGPLSSTRAPVSMTFDLKSIQSEMEALQKKAKTAFEKIGRVPTSPVTEMESKEKAVELEFEPVEEEETKSAEPAASMEFHLEAVDDNNSDVRARANYYIPSAEELAAASYPSSSSSSTPPSAPSAPPSSAPPPVAPTPPPPPSTPSTP